MTKRAMCSLVLIAIVLSLRVNAQLKPVMKVVPQPGAPVSITSYSASYESRTSQYTTRGIHHNLQYENNSSKDIVAMQLGLISFNVWNEFLDRTNGLDTDILQPGKNRRGGWIATTLSDFSFLTGVAYVRRVRFADGEIWMADEDEVLEEMRKIEKNFDASTLKKPESEK